MKLNKDDFFFHCLVQKRVTVLQITFIMKTKKSKRATIITILVRLLPE